jgi:hypothetical protein
LSSDKEAASDIATHCNQECVKGDNERHKQSLQGAMTTTHRDDGHAWLGGGWLQHKMHLDHRTQWQASGEATYGLLQEASRGGLLQL